jgi:hypothetical protein
MPRVARYSFLISVVTLLLLIIAFGAAIVSVTQPTAVFEKKLVGQWVMSGDPLLVLSLHESGRWDLYMSIDGSDQSLQQIDSGTWRVRDRQLQVFSTAEALLPMLRDKYLMQRDGYRILAISNICVFVDRDGTSCTWLRRGDASAVRSQHP